MSQWINEGMKEWRNEEMTEWRNEGMKEWRNEGTKEWRNEGIKESRNQGRNEWMNEWMSEWVWMNEWMNEWTNDRTNEWMNECINGYVDGFLEEWSAFLCLSCFFTDRPLGWGTSSLGYFFSEQPLLWPFCELPLSYLFYSFCDPIFSAELFQCSQQPPAAIPHSKSVAASLMLCCAVLMRFVTVVANPHSRSEQHSH